MSSTKEVYNHLLDAHGISRQLCKHCMNRDIEVYQDQWESCYICWCTECEPKISPPED